MIVLYAEKQDMGIKYAAALGGISYNGKLIDIDNLAPYNKDIKRDLADKDGYIKTIYEGKEYIVTWGWGHFGKLFDVKDYHPEYKYWSDIPLPFFPEKFKVKRIEEKQEHFKKRNDRQMQVITKLFNSPQCEYIINGTDWEREGELIFAYIYDLTGTNKPYVRLRSNAKTKKQIQKDFSKLVDSDENYPKVLAARARSIADWTVGINMTIAATRYLSDDGSMLNVGRVFTPTLKLIVDREDEINNYVEKESFGIQGEFTLPNGEKYIGKCDTLYEKETEAKDSMSSLNPKAYISSVTVKTEKKEPPLLHNTQSLQVEANEVYGFTLKETGAIAQSLYEKGFTTYPRVDSQYLTEDKKGEMEAIMVKISRLPEYQGKFAPKNLPDRYFNNKKVDGHDAIITTDEMPSSLTEDEKKIYDLIVRRMIMAISNPAVAEKTTVITQSTDTETGEIVEFKTHGTKYLDKGFLVFKPGKHKEEAPPLTPAIKEGLDPNGVYSVYTQVSKPPQRYTDASLVKAMENCGKKMEDEKAKEFLKKSRGIGRPATRDSVVERLINAHFVERSNKSLKPTESGINAIRKITIDDIKSPTLTAAWEEQLDTIEQSNKADSLKEFAAFIKDIKTTTAKWCEETEAHKVIQKRKSNKYDTGLTCPLCGGTVLRGTDSYYCSNYKEKGCKFQVKYEISSKKISEAVLTQLVEKGRTNILKGFKSKAGSTFNARLTLQDALICNKCNAIQSGNETCYKCGGELSRDPNGRKLVAFTDISK